MQTTIPIGATSTNLTLTVIPQVNSTGVLDLPSGMAHGNVTISLSSPIANLSVNGAVYVSSFHAPPGTYSAYATATAGGTTYASLSRVTVSATGNITPAISLSVAGPKLVGTLVNPTGGVVGLNGSVHLVAPGGAVAVAPAVNGSFSLALNPSTAYSVFINGTSTTSGPNGTFVQSWRVASGTQCAVGTLATTCNVPLLGTPEPVWLNGTLTAYGVPGPVPGTVRLVGPYPSTNATVLTTSSGSFSVYLAPGAYSLYATGGGSDQPLASLSHVLALPTSSRGLTVTLSPTWVETISVAPPNGTSAGLGPITVTVSNSLGAQVLYPGETSNSPISLALPAGTYVVRAAAFGSFGGVPANASAQATVTIVSGNVGTVLDLAYQTTTSVGGKIVGPDSATVAAGGNVAFSFSVRNTGNVPVTVHPVGTPSYWNFNFSFASTTLLPGPAGTVLSGEVRFVVPAGTLVAHPGIVIEFALPDGTIVGAVTPAPTVNVVGYYGIAAGPSSSASQVGPSTAQVPFYVQNTGNVGETVVATIGDAARLAGLGWSSTFLTSTTPGTIHKFIAAGNNLTLLVNLSATSSIFVPPGTVTVDLTVLNASGGLSTSTTLKVPIVGVSAGGGNGAPPFTVSGPSVGSSPNLPPYWVVPLLCFVPAIALVAGIFTLRWWRTRRWSRR